MRILASAVLVSEALVVFFATLVAQGLGDTSAGTVWLMGGALSLACLLASGLLRRRWGYVLGSVLQLAVVAAGFVVTLMFALGLVFAALWVAALVYGARAEAVRAAHLNARAAADGTGSPEPPATGAAAQ